MTTRQQITDLLERVEGATLPDSKPCVVCGEVYFWPRTYTSPQWAARRCCSHRCDAILKARRLFKPMKQRLEEQSERDNETGCINWTGYRNRWGYGRLTFQGRVVMAHIAAYEEHVGPRNGLHVCHRCDNPRCINPEHLFLGTNFDNHLDKMAKGRQARGERAGHAKLTEDAVREIRASSGSHTALAAKYGVGPGAIRNIRIGKTWRHV